MFLFSSLNSPSFSGLSIHCWCMFPGLCVGILLPYWGYWFQLRFMNYSYAGLHLSWNFLPISFLTLLQARAVNNIFDRYNVRDKVAPVEDEEEDNVWEIIHGDVFRFPRCRTLLSAILGVFWKASCLILTNANILMWQRLNRNVLIVLNQNFQINFFNILTVLNLIL